MNTTSHLKQSATSCVQPNALTDVQVSEEGKKEQTSHKQDRSRHKMTKALLIAPTITSKQAKESEETKKHAK